MAIFGNLSEMPLADVFAMVGRYTGRVTIWNTPTEHYYELHIDEGALTALLVNQESIQDVFPLRDRITELINLTSGEFEFQNLHGDLLLTQHDLSLDTLLLSGLAALDEVAAHRSQFPSPQTVFRTRSGKDPWLTGDLHDFWLCSSHLLSQGASAEIIAAQTSVSTDQVLLCLYKLRTAGVIAPFRAFQYDPASVSRWPERGMDSPEPVKAEKPANGGGIIHRIMLRLRRGFMS